MENYNCQGSIDSTYGAAAYGSCTPTVGAPNTGVQAFMTSSSLFIILPLAFLIFLTLTTIAIKKYKRSRAS